MNLANTAAKPIAAPSPDSVRGGSQRRAGNQRGAMGTECRIKALKMLATNLLQQMEAMESSRPETRTTVNAHSLVDQFEAQLIRSALLLTGGHQRRAATILGLKPNTLNNKMRRYELQATENHLPTRSDL
jgi:DNA-binding NtrC family response regulator